MRDWSSRTAGNRDARYEHGRNGRGIAELINGADLGLVAEINAARDGINVRSRLSGADLTIGENGGTLATQLGIRTYTAESKLTDFNRGVGVPTATDPAETIC